VEIALKLAPSPGKQSRAYDNAQFFHLQFAERQVVEMTVDYWRQKEDAKFEEAFAKLEC